MKGLALPAVLLAAGILLIPGTLLASNESAGGGAGESLLLMTSARSEGILASVAGGGGLNGLASNPAALAGQAHAAISGSYTQLLGGSTLGQLESAIPAGPVVFAVSLGSFNAGEADVPGDAGTVKKVQLQNDVVAGGSVAMPVGGGLSAGLSMKWYQSTLAETYTATTQLFDAGVGYALLDGDLVFGGSARNIGGRLKYYSSTQGVPVWFSAGSAWRAWHGGENSVSLLGEIGRRPGVNSIYSIGTEAVFKGVLILRGGVRMEGGLSAASAGAGIRFRSYGFDFARVSQPGLPASSRVSAEIRL